MNPFQKIKSAVNKCQRFFINRSLQRKLTNQGMTVISANCVGAFILHDLHQPFNSPFVNLCLSPQDFLRYLQNMDFYRTQPLHSYKQKKVIQWENLPILKFILCIITVSKKPMKNGNFARHE